MIEQKISENTFLVTDLRQGEYVFVKPGGSDFGEVSGEVVGLYVPLAEPAASYGLKPKKFPPSVEIHLHLEDEHPAMQDFLADNPDRDSDYAEFYSIVAIRDIERGDGTPIRIWERSITPRERSTRARERGFSRLALPELDAGLRR